MKNPKRYVYTNDQQKSQHRRQNVKTSLKYLYIHITDFPGGVGDYESCPSHSSGVVGWCDGAG